MMEETIVRFVELKSYEIYYITRIGNKGTNWPNIKIINAASYKAAKESFLAMWGVPSEQYDHSPTIYSVPYTLNTTLGTTLTIVISTIIEN